MDKSIEKEDMETMKTQWKDVAHLYLGCEVEIELNEGKTVAVFRGLNSFLWYVELDGFKEVHYQGPLKPILRKLEDMRESDLKERYPDVNLNELFSDTGMTKGEVLRKYLTSPKGWGVKMYERFSILDSVDDIKWLFSKGFDLFGLIDSGQAIEKKTEKV